MTKEEYRQQIFGLAKDSLEKHILRQELDTEKFKIWMCRNPDNSFYWYRVVAIPGCLIVQGDVGNRIFTMYDADPVSWIKGAAKSPDYVMGKCEDKRKDFLSGEAKVLLQELLQENDLEECSSKNETLVRKVEDIEEAWYDEGDGDQFSRAYCEAGFDSEDLLSCYDFNSDVIWSYLCLKKFVELLGTQAATV